MSSLIPDVQTVRVSSVLNKDTKQFGKQHLFDGKIETCWNSHQGTPQSILISFVRPVVIEQVHVQFQGGFVGKNCSFFASFSNKEGNELVHVSDFYPQDGNQLQKFEFGTKDPVNKVKIVFADSFDFFGRITIYKLELLGE